MNVYAYSFCKVPMKSTTFLSFLPLITKLSGAKVMKAKAFKMKNDLVQLEIPINFSNYILMSTLVS